MSSFLQLNTNTIALLGQPTLTSFRIDDCLKKCQLVNSSVEGIDCHEVFILHFQSDLDVINKDTHINLKKILKVLVDGILFKEESNIFYIFPRIGTISSWSSKSTDILHNSGIDKLLRIERGLAYKIFSKLTISKEDMRDISETMKDRMVEDVFFDIQETTKLFSEILPQPIRKIPILSEGKKALENANKDLGLALNNEEIDFLFRNYLEENLNPSDAELMMFAQVNSEHCRHKIFNAKWLGRDRPCDKSLFGMIRNTFLKNDHGILSAYVDNAAVIEGFDGERFFPDSNSKVYSSYKEPVHIVVKVETHNHPTAIAPFPGAATGSGGEIRDEGATGKGAKPKAGLCGYSVSNLRIPGHEEPWEGAQDSPSHIANPLSIMLEAPIGSAAFNNEFGRPNLLGYFRSLEVEGNQSIKYGYHKPIMLAGGIGNIRESDIKKGEVPVGSKLVLLGGPAMRIGLGGGSASSLSSGSGNDELDFASVQRENAEMERRCQEVLDRCWQKSNNNPILFIHDVGAGGLSNAVPELVKDSGHGGIIYLRDIPSSETRMSPMEIWCNESQERYVLAIHPDSIDSFNRYCLRERCPTAVIGEIVDGKRLKVYDELFDNYPVDISLDVLFGNTPEIKRTYKKFRPIINSLELKKEALDTLLFKVLRHPSVACKNFLITIGDRSVSGLVARDQMVGPWQVPVADNAITLSGYIGVSGEAMSIGEKSSLAISNAAASARMAIGESVTNILSSGIEDISDIKLSANWMGAPNHHTGNEELYAAVYSVGMELCPEWKITIPVGKDSLSMATKWQDKNKLKEVISPLSLVVTSFSKIKDVTSSITPQLISSLEETTLIFVDLGKGKNRMGGSIAAQVQNLIVGEVPDVEVKSEMKEIVSVVSKLINRSKILAYHDRSDGGLITCLIEMAFAGRLGLHIDLKEICGSRKKINEVLFSEELGFVIQVLKKDSLMVMDSLSKVGMKGHIYNLGRVTQHKDLCLAINNKVIAEWNQDDLLKEWHKVSFYMQQIRDNPVTAEAEYQSDINANKYPLSPKINFTIPAKIRRRYSKPLIAILREQGVNGHVEMAAAFDRAGFNCVDVHMTDLINRDRRLAEFHGIVACGGFSYGDVLGAGNGWSTTILNNYELKSEFEDFFHQEKKFSLGVCNGCQMMANLSSLIPGAEFWPQFIKNESEKFEARLVEVKINDTPSIFFKGMSGSTIPVPVAHGEGKVHFNDDQVQDVLSISAIAIQYADHKRLPTEAYPENPNGSTLGIAGFTNKIGNSTIMMPHPERAFLTIQHSWAPKEWKKYGPWIQFFVNARDFIG